MVTKLLYDSRNNIYKSPRNGKAAWSYKDTEPWGGYGTGADGAVTISENTVYSNEINATDFVLDAAITLTTTRLHPIVIRATRSITINGTINADGKGFTYQEGWNYFNLAVYNQNIAGSVGISGGGCSANAGRIYNGGQAVEVNDFLAFLRNSYDFFLTKDINMFPKYGGGGGGDLSNLSVYCTGGGGIILVAPTIIHNGHLTSRGLPGSGGSWNGNGGGGGGLIALFSRTLSGQGTYEACGGGGGGGAWNGVGNAGSWQNGGASTGKGYTRGGAGGGSTALNADGGTAGVGGGGTQYTGMSGSTTGQGGGGGNETGSDRGGRGGSGGGAGKIAWIQLNR
ncbi:MAG: hypothetical protein IKP06_05575 [Elusimicrobiaceae bacterium]|nr:hypothetical protein [Elusimicrobiaceae bacterium]